MKFLVLWSVGGLAVFIVSIRLVNAIGRRMNPVPESERKWNRKINHLLITLMSITCGPLSVMLLIYCVARLKQKGERPIA